MMKRIIAIFLVIMMFLTLTACSRASRSQPSNEFSETNYSETADVTLGKNDEESDDNTTDRYDESVDSTTSSDKIVADDIDTSKKEETKSTEKQPSLEGTEQTEPPRVTEEATKPKIPQDSTAEEKKDSTQSKEPEVTKPTESQTESSTEQKTEDTTLPQETESTEPPKEKPPADEQKKDEETKPAVQFDITYWINYAKDYATTDKNGVAIFNDILIGANYTIEEVNTPVRYVIPESQGAVIEWNKATEKSFENILKKWRADVYKLDSELSNKNGSSGVPVKVVSADELGGAYGKTQGDATLAGAVYGVYKGETLVDTYTTDKDGHFVTKYYVCDDDWSIREITPSEGYLLDDTIYHVDCSAGNYTVELNTEYPDVYEDIIKGKITIIKHCDDGSTKIETPEQGAVFAVYLKTAGSYDNAKETERALLTCDEHGFAETDWLPYGVYVVEQIEGWEGKEMMPAFDIKVHADGEIYRYLINNATFEAEIEIVKKDAESGKVIPASGIGFKVRNKDTGEFVIQRINYPTPTDIEIYYTDAQGKLMLPYALPYGNYEIIEQNTCFGYVLDSTPVAFKVDGSTDLVTVIKSNYAQKGTITISKFGEVFSSVAEKDGIYQPVYEIKGLEGAVYEVIAVEDVITLDGTTRYTKGQVVATITTGKDGKATTEPLYLGKYEIREVKAPYGMVLNTEPVNVELVYAGEHVEITETSASFTNERQKMVIDLKKTMENDEIFGIGTNGEITNVQFGMYAAKDMTAADGKIIPKDALIETAYCDKDGNIVFMTDLPVGAKVYIKETNTDCHYVINDESFKVDFNYAGQETKIIRESVNKGEAIENEILRGTIVGKKVDEDGFTICGALFGLFRADETEFTEKTAVLTCESNEIGIFYFENVPYGNWIVREIKAAPAFVLNETSYEVTIDKDGAYLAAEIHQSQVRELQKQLGELKDERQDEFESRILGMLQDVKKLKALIDEIEEPLDEFDEKLFEEIVVEMSLSNQDELTITVLGELKFTELI